ncbi:centrobin-like [Daphnia carinata]|uniref:centrobin-like n=1 Tax=Daphnia carinata TaxID=120202 RepID=UPI00257FE2BA|nr:centrobin-like [Daphnia carinata]
MEQSSEHQGELSLIEMMESLKVPGGRKTPDRSVQSTHSSPASIAIALNEEQHRRQECEKVIQQLQTHISSLQQEHAVAKAALQRKDSLLMQAQQQWKTVESDWNQRLSLANEEKDRLTTTVARLEGQVQISIAEARKKTMELQAVVRQNDEILRSLREENANLKEKHDQSQYELKEITIQLEGSKKEVKQNENKIDDLKRENHRIKSQIEDLKREKERSVVELELLQQRFEASQEQHENYSQVRIKEATKNAEEEANRRLQIWQNEVESKMSHLINTLEHQLGILKAKSLEESQAREARHQEEMKAMRAQCTTLLQQVKYQKKEHDELTRKMRQLAEAQWNTVNKITPSSGGRQTAPSIVASEISDATLLTSDSTNTNVLVIQDEFRKYVSQRHGAQPSSKDTKERNEPTSRRTK